MWAMNARPRNDELSIRLFYTVCAAAALVGCAIAQFVHFYSWEPGPRTLLWVVVMAGLVLIPVWRVPKIRTSPFDLVRGWSDVPLLLWAFMAPVAALLLVSLTLTVPWIAMFKYGGGAGLLTIPAAALIVWLTWWIPTPSHQLRNGE
jgi:hypothetical protein